MARKDWKYTGDMNLEHGGLFFKLPDAHPLDGDAYDTVEAVEVIDVSSAVGGPDCIHRIERGIIYMPRHLWQDALRGCDWMHRKDGQGRDVIFDGQDEHPVDGEGLIFLVDAFRSYSGIENPDTATVQIGKLTAYDPEPIYEPDTFLRGNTKLTNYVEREWL